MPQNFSQVERIVAKIFVVTMHGLQKILQKFSLPERNLAKIFVEKEHVTRSVTHQDKIRGSLLVCPSVQNVRNIFQPRSLLVITNYGYKTRLGVIFVLKSRERRPATTQTNLCSQVRRMLTKQDTNKLL